MYLFIILAVVSIELALALPSNSTWPKQQFSIPLMLRKTKALNSSNSNTTATLSARSDSGLRVSQQLIPNVDYIDYVAAVDVRGVEVILSIDISTTLTWAFSSAMSQDQTVGHKLLEIAPGDYGDEWTQKYPNDQWASGINIITTIKFGPLQATREKVGAATAVSDGIQQVTSRDGFLGLGQGYGQWSVPRSFLVRIENQLPEPMFTISLRKVDAPSTLHFGGIDPSYLGDEPFLYIPATKHPEDWGFKVTGMFFTDKRALIESRLFASLRTASRDWNLPYVVARSFYEQIPGWRFTGDRRYIIPCDSEMPSISMYVNDAVFTAPGNNLKFGPVGWIDGQAFCDCGLQASPPRTQRHTFGVAFFHVFFTVFKFRTKELSFAPQPLDSRS